MTKRFLALIMVTVLAFAMVGCGGGSNTESASSTQTAPAAAETSNDTQSAAEVVASITDPAAVSEIISKSKSIVLNAETPEALWNGLLATAWLTLARTDANGNGGVLIANMDEAEKTANTVLVGFTNEGLAYVKDGNNEFICQGEYVTGYDDENHMCVSIADYYIVTIIDGLMTVGDENTTIYFQQIQ